MGTDNPLFKTESMKEVPMPQLTLLAIKPPKQVLAVQPFSPQEDWLLAISQGAEESATYTVPTHMSTTNEMMTNIIKFGNWMNTGLVESRLEQQRFLTHIVKDLYGKTQDTQKFYIDFNKLIKWMGEHFKAIEKREEVISKENLEIFKHLTIIINDIKTIGDQNKILNDSLITIEKKVAEILRQLSNSSENQRENLEPIHGILATLNNTIDNFDCDIGLLKKENLISKTET